MITNKVVSERTEQDTVEAITRKRRLRWFGHIYRMDSNRLACQVMDCTLPDFNRKGRHPKVLWAIKGDLDLLGVIWE